MDDYWSVVLVFDTDHRLRRVGELSRDLRYVWVEPPEGYSGRWKTYYVNGVISHDIDYENRQYRRLRAYYENGRLTQEQRYVHGQIDGDERGFDPSGRRLYEIHHAMGRDVGHWVHWYPNGRVQSESDHVMGELHGVSTHYREDGSRETVFHYDHGQETGQAAWDEHGALIYAHGSCEATERDR